jgi:hypothetical protein
MLVKCRKCGYENFPQHRYCGMCATDLRLPSAAVAQPTLPPEPLPASDIPEHKAPEYKEEAVARPKKVVPEQLSGPSFLGLGNEPAEEKVFSYLLEDETPSHRGRNLILLLLIAALAAAFWHWRQDLRVVADRLLNTLPPAEKSGSSDKPQPNSPAPVASDSTSGTAPASSAPAPIEQVGAQAPAAQTPPTAAPAAPAASGTPDSTQPVQQTQPPNQSRASEATSKAATAKPDESEEAATPPARATKSDTRAERATASAPRGDDLEVQGEKYLYGNGVPENCTRARTNLLAAAEQSNAQAQSVLATMYATGHCATRDLPTAYRWFGRSLRQDPKNSRIEQDLRVLWNQMTPEERQRALRSER